MARFRSLVGELGGEKDALQRPQEADAYRERQGQEDDEMDPDRGFVGHLDEQHREGAEEAGDQDDEDGGTIAGIGLGQIVAAAVSGRRDLQEA